MEKDGTIEINLPLDCDSPFASVHTDYPNEGRMTISAKKGGDYSIRILPFMQRGLEARVNGQSGPLAIQDDILRMERVEAGSDIVLEHTLKNTLQKEHVQGREYSVLWRGADVINIDPPGEPLRLYQRNADVELEVPDPPPKKKEIPRGGLDVRPTEQKRF